MNFVDQVNCIKKLQDNLMKYQKDIKKSCKKLEKELQKVISKRLKEEFPDVKFSSPNQISYDWLVDTQLGCMTNDWKPEVYFYSVAGVELSNKGFWYDYIIGDNGLFEKYEKVKSPISIKKFTAFLKKLSEELGVTCRMIRREPLNPIRKNQVEYSDSWE